MSVVFSGCRQAVPRDWHGVPVPIVRCKRADSANLADKHQDCGVVLGVGAGSRILDVGFLLALVSQFALMVIAIRVAPPELEMGDGRMNVR
jgi:hypothetical protein